MTQENVTGETIRAGDRVRFYFYGCLQYGIVVKEPANGIVWVAREDRGGIRWMHIDSVSLA